jgi:RHS repeat-associated protein
MYKPWGETRPQNGSTVGTKYQYTGQYNETSIGLYFYGARFYDPYLNRWAQPDTIIPLASQGVQAWDRYAYANNNPVRWNDPTGHEIPCGSLCNFWGQLYDSVMQNIGITYVYENNQADNVGGLMVLAFFQELSAEITGNALNDIANDKTLLAIQNSRIEEIKSDPRYGKDEFSLDFGSKPVTFGEMGNNNMFEDATHSQTWTVRAANVNTVAKVSNAGEITFNYELNDRLDLRPDWDSGMRTGWSGFGYNVVTTITGAVWHNFLGAREMDTHASWTNTVKREE